MSSSLWQRGCVASWQLVTYPAVAGSMGRRWRCLIADILSEQLSAMAWEELLERELWLPCSPGAMTVRHVPCTGSQASLPG